MRPVGDELSPFTRAQHATQAARFRTMLPPICTHCRRQLNDDEIAEAERLAAWQSATCTDCAISHAQRDPEPAYIFDRGVMLV